MLNFKICKNGQISWWLKQKYLMPVSNAWIEIMYFVQSRYIQIQAKAGCVSPSLMLRHVFVVWYKDNGLYETKTSSCKESQSWCSLHVEFFISFLQWFTYQMTKMWRNPNDWKLIPVQLSLDLYITRWEIKHSS